MRRWPLKNVNFWTVSDCNSSFFSLVWNCEWTAIVTKKMNPQQIATIPVTFKHFWLNIWVMNYLVMYSIPLPTARLSCSWRCNTSVPDEVVVDDEIRQGKGKQRKSFTKLFKKLEQFVHAFPLIWEDSRLQAWDCNTGFPLCLVNWEQVYVWVQKIVIMNCLVMQ